MVDEYSGTDQVKVPQYANDLFDCNGVLDLSDEGPRASGQCDPGSVRIVPTRELCMQIYQQATVGRIAGTRRSGDARRSRPSLLSTASSTGMSILLFQRGAAMDRMRNPEEEEG